MRETKMGAWRRYILYLMLTLEVVSALVVQDRKPWDAEPGINPDFNVEEGVKLNADRQVELELERGVKLGGESRVERGVERTCRQNELANRILVACMNIMDKRQINQRYVLPQQVDHAEPEEEEKIPDSLDFSRTTVKKKIQPAGGNIFDFERWKKNDGKGIEATGVGNDKINYQDTWGSKLARLRAKLVEWMNGDKSAQLNSNKAEKVDELNQDLSPLKFSDHSAQVDSSKMKVDEVNQDLSPLVGEDNPSEYEIESVGLSEDEEKIGATHFVRENVEYVTRSVENSNTASKKKKVPTATLR